MDFNLSPEQVQIREEIRTLTQRVEELNAKIAADRGRGGFGILPGIARERRALTQLLDDPVGVRHHLRDAVAGCREEDLANAIFLATLGGIHPVQHGFDLVIAETQALGKQVILIRIGSGAERDQGQSNSKGGGDFAC